MGKREDDRDRKHQARCREIEKLGWAQTEAFEQALDVPATDYRLGTYQRVMHRTIMHFVRKGLANNHYEKDYEIAENYMNKAIDLIGRQTKLALATHKIDLELAKLERQQTLDRHKRHLAQNARKFWDQPHASHFEPDKHIKPGERSAADVSLATLQSPDEDGDALP
jgi:hypothetical protein